MAGVAHIDRSKRYILGFCSRATRKSQCLRFLKFRDFWSKWATSRQPSSVSYTLTGSTDWIGSFEVSYVLNKLVGIDSVIINIASGDQVLGKLDDIKNHFDVYGTPIMIGIVLVNNRRRCTSVYDARYPD